MNIEKLASKLRSIAKSSEVSSAEGRTELEKLATIALIHDQRIKTPTLVNNTSKVANIGSKLKKALIGTGVLGGSAYAGYKGHEKGKSTGRSKGQKEMYHAALPHVRRSAARARRAEAVARYLARKSDMQKKSNLKTVAKGLGLAALPAGSYYAGKRYGREKGQKKGKKEVALSALRRIGRDNTRFRRAMNYIMSQKRKARSASKGGK